MSNGTDTNEPAKRKLFYSHNRNRRRELWESIPEQGKTLDDLAIGQTGTKHAVSQTVGKMIIEGTLIKKSGMQVDSRIITYFRNPASTGPEIKNGHRRNVATSIRVNGLSTVDLIDQIETKFLELGELMDQVRPRLITEEILTELGELRALKATVEASLGRTTGGR